MNLDDLEKLDVDKAYEPDGTFEIQRGRVKLTLARHLAGAIYKFSFAGTEFVHPVPIVGASMQSTAAMDIPKGGSAELRNPTEAGCADLDSFTGKSSSEMLDLRASKHAVYTSTRAAYFRKPGAVVKGKKVLNTTVVSDVIMRKFLRFVDDRTLEYTIEQIFPKNMYSRTLSAVIACWVPWTSSEQMHVLDAKGEFHVMKQGTRYVDAKAIVISTKDGSRAMGVACVSAPPKGPRHFKFGKTREGVWRSWNHVQAIDDPSGTVSWKHVVRFGTLTGVKSYLTKLFKV